MPTITFQSQTKFFQAKRKVKERLGKDGEPEEILEEYIKLGGSYKEDGEWKNVIGNPNLGAQLAKIQQDNNPKPPETGMGKKRLPEVKPTLQIKKRVEK